MSNRLGIGVIAALTAFSNSGCESGPAGTVEDLTVWRYPAENLFLGDPAGDHDRVYIAVADTLIALSQESGLPVWKALPTMGERISTASLAVDGGVVYGQSGGKVFAYSASSGREIWITDLFPAFGPAYPGSAVALGQTSVYASSGAGEIYSLDRLTGTIQWHTTVHPRPRGVIEASDMVCVSSDARFSETPQGMVTCLSKSSGEESWRYEVPDTDEQGKRLCHEGGIAGPPAYEDGLLFFGDQCGHLVSLRSETGEVVWIRRFNTAFDASVILDPPSGYTCTRTTECISFDLASGALRWQSSLRGSARDAPVLDGNVLYVADIGGYLYRLEVITGQILQTLSPLGEHLFFSRRPVVGADLIFSGGGRYYVALKK
ncbi:MAG: PQQ-binding-like beta-propeller repeat protein [Gemmatimonadetes bacterium]|nr:PQQ-binding-like beta-propeller repeat protein [Gemmatimonadota bacterium]